MTSIEAMSLLDFLLARIADDERVARDALDGPWHIDPRGSVVSGDDLVLHPMRGERDDLDHVVRHHPARVLSECEAKREVIRMFVDYYCPTAGESPHDPIAVLALPYADHGDYREEWRA